MQKSKIELLRVRFDEQVRGEMCKLRAQLTGAQLLVIDDLFLRKLPSGAGDELADVLISRYEKALTIITSNRGLEDWATLLGDIVVVGPLLDRLMHHGHLLKFDGKRRLVAERTGDCTRRATRLPARSAATP